MINGTLVGGLFKIYIIVFLHLTHQPELMCNLQLQYVKTTLLTLGLFLLEGKNAGEDGRRDTSYQINLKIFRYFLHGHLWVSSITSFSNRSQFLICNMLRTIKWPTPSIWTHSWCPNFAPCSYSPTWKGLRSSSTESPKNYWIKC